MWTVIGSVAVVVLGGVAAALAVVWRRSRDASRSREALAAGFTVGCGLAAVVIAAALVLHAIPGGESAEVATADQRADESSARQPSTTATAATQPTRPAFGVGDPPADAIVAGAEERIATCRGICVVITAVERTDHGELVIWWEPVNFWDTPSLTSFHAHAFFDVFEPEQVGSNADQFGVTQGNWQLTAESPFRTTGTNVSLDRAPAGAERLCLAAADSGHGVINPENADCVALESA